MLVVGRCQDIAAKSVFGNRHGDGYSDKVSKGM